MLFCSCVVMRIAIHTTTNKLNDIILLLSSVNNCRGNNMVYYLSLYGIETNFELRLILVITLKEILIS